MRLRLGADALMGACAGACASAALGLVEYEASEAYLANLLLVDRLIYGTLCGACAGVCAGTLLECAAAGAVASSVALALARAAG
jgi:hypothetical protein